MKILLYQIIIISKVCKSSNWHCRKTTVPQPVHLFWVQKWIATWKCTWFSVMHIPHIRIMIIVSIPIHHHHYCYTLRIPAGSKGTISVKNFIRKRKDFFVPAAVLAPSPKKSLTTINCLFAENYNHSQILFCEPSSRY